MNNETILTPVLYAEDDENDAFLMERAFEKLHITNALKIVSDGKLAIAYLSGQPPYNDPAKDPLPGLMLLDLSLPGKKGLDVLQWARAQPNLAGLPIVVFTSSNQQSDIHRSYLIGANGFFIKPGDPEDLISIMRAVKEHWLEGKPSPESFIEISAFRQKSEVTKSIP